MDKSPIIVYPRTINHIAVSVTDLNRAVKWYKEVFGFTVVNGPVEFEADDSSLGIAARDIHGPNFRKMRMVWLSSGNQVGFEMFEYIDPKAERRIDNFEYWKSGFFHICVTDPNIEELCKRISDSGGRQRSRIWDVDPEKGYKIAFCEDPFGNVIEIYTHSYERLVTSF
jgi:catechol 2,3-dioxygenase-like lactoylglutathione lyase family enzyme